RPLAADGGAAGVQAGVPHDRGRRHRHRHRRRGPVPDGRELRPRVRAHTGRRDPARPVRRLLLQAADGLPDRPEPEARRDAGLRAGIRDRRRPHRDRHVRGAGVVNTREFFDVYRGYRIPHFKLIEHRNRWFAFSAVLIVLSLLGIFVRGFNFSIDFEGGARISYPVRTSITVQDVEATMAAHGYTDAEVQIVGGDTVQIRSASLSGTTAGASVPASATPQGSVSPGASA